MRSIAADNQQLRPISIFLCSTSLTHYKVSADKMVFKAGGVYRGDLVRLAYQADGSCPVENFCKYSLKDVFFKSLFCVFWRVV